MDSSLISGPMMSVIGISTVFVVLVSLVGVVTVMRRWFDEQEAAVAGNAVAEASTAPIAVSDTESAPEADSDDQPVDDLLAVALATYAYHRSRRAVSNAPPQTSDWSSAGRVRQIATFRR